MKRTSSPARTIRKKKTLTCQECGESVARGRADLGYKTCLKCGEHAAKKEIAAKKERVAIAYNKGAYMYITPGQDPKSIGRKV